jgi:hypothetical protein
MGDGRHCNGRQRQRRYDPNGRQWWWCNGWQDGSNSTMAINMIGGRSKEGNGNGNEGGWQAKEVRRTKRVVATVMRMAGDKEGNGNGGKSDGNGVEGGGRW